MPSSKPLARKKDFFMQRKEAAAVDLRESSQETERSIDAYISGLNKDRQYIDIGRFEDAPKEWNDFPPIPPVKRAQIKLSIMNNGILQPVIGWERPNGKIMILAGHNRVAISKEIIAEYADVSQHNYDYSKIPTILYGANEIDEARAREIIIDTNYLQRNDLDPRTRVMVIKARVGLMNAQKDEKGRTIKEMIAAIPGLEIKRSAVYQDIQIGTSIIRPLQELYFDGKLNRKAILKLAMLTEDMQTWLYETYPDKLTNDRVLKITKGTKLKAQLSAIFDEDSGSSERMVRSTFNLPEKDVKTIRKMSSLYATDEDFRALCDQYLKDKLGEEEETEE